MSEWALPEPCEHSNLIGWDEAEDEALSERTHYQTQGLRCVDCGQSVYLHAIRHVAQGSDNTP